MLHTIEIKIFGLVKPETHFKQEGKKVFYCCWKSAGTSLIDMTQ